MKNNLLDIIFECTKALNDVKNTETLLDDVLSIFNKNGFHYSAIKFIDPLSEEIIIRFASGLPEDQKTTKYKLGEGITGKVVQSGTPIIIENTGEDSRFLNKTGESTNDNDSFYCFPITIDGKTIGAISALYKVTNSTEHKNNIELFETINPLLCQFLKINEQFKYDQKDIEEQNRSLRSELAGIKKNNSKIIGTSGKMTVLYDQINMVVNSNATVLITGESGTGKELVADALHHGSYRSTKPFIKVNCAALPENLLESELFGHEKGSFTGANYQKKGRFELAEGGTLFLDEIGEINQNIQVKLLRFLQCREFERVGGIETIQSVVRVVAATNMKLEEEVKKGNFREDLYYRLNVFPIYVPPLRDRQTDITLLSNHFLEKYATENGKDVTRISTPAINMLMCYHWPGNIRELENCMERAILVCQSDTIRASDLPPTLQTAGSDISEPAPFLKSDTWTLPEAVANLEKEMITEALKNFKGHQGKAAKALGVTERQIGYKIQKYDITKNVFS
ncbi:MAG: sigma 54-interacting transcriptional regulator [Fibrobacterales bacterium]